MQYSKGRAIPIAVDRDKGKIGSKPCCGCCQNGHHLLILALPVLILAGCSDSLTSARAIAFELRTPPPSSLERHSAPLSRRRAIADLQGRAGEARRRGIEPRPRPRPSRPRRKTRTRTFNRAASCPRARFCGSNAHPLGIGLLVGGQRDKRVNSDFHRIQAASALRLRAGQQAQGAGARARRRHHRFRHGQSRHADAGPHRAEAGRDGARSAHQPLLGLARHPGPAAGAGRLLRAPLRRDAQSRDADRRDARLQGRLRQHGAGHHRARRRHSRAEPDLSDPRVRLHHVRRRDPPSAGFDQLQPS